MKLLTFIALVYLAHQIHCFAVPNDDIHQYLMERRPKRDGVSSFLFHIIYLTKIIKKFKNKRLRKTVFL